MKSYWLALPMALFCGLAFADWSLNNDRSRLSFVSVKNGNIAEVHRFKQLEGVVDDGGKVDLTIQLASVDTAIPIRDERMQQMLFETNLFPVAKVSAQLDMVEIQALAPGESLAATVNVEIELHGQQKAFEADLLVVRLSPTKILVITQEPMVINAQDFALVEGVEKLREVAQLPSIGMAVPVTFTMTFESTP